MIRLHNPHHSILLQQVEKLWRCGTLCDTVLETEGCTFEAHALVLACASKTLERHLSTQGGGPRYYCILDPLSARVLQQLLDYMYREWLEVSEEDMSELLRVAKSLRVEQLLEQCQAWLKSTTKQEEEGGPGLSSKVSAKGNYQEKRRGQPRDDLSPRSPLTKDPISQPSPPHVPSASPHRKRDGPSLSSRSLTLSRERPFTVTVDPTTSAALSQMSHLAWAPSRRMLLSPSDLLTIQSMRSSPHTLTYPYLSHHAAFAAPRRSLHAFGPASLQGCVGLLPPHRHLPLHNASPELKQGNLAKREPISTASAAALYEVKEERKPKMERGEKMCYRHSSTTLLENPWRQMSDPPPSTGQHAAAHECKFCKQNVRDRRRSLRRCANGEKPYQCQHCTKRFSLKHQLDTHLRVHTGEKPFECRLCGQRSRDYSAMIKHLRTHSGATPYQCTLCLEFCSSQTAMQKHLKAHPVQDFPPDWTLASTYLYTCHS